MTRAPLLETLSSTLIRHRHAATEAWSASAAGASTKAFVPAVPREGRRFPGGLGCFPSYACVTGSLPVSPPFTGGGPAVTLHSVRSALLRANQRLYCAPSVRPALTSQAYAERLGQRATAGFCSRLPGLPGFVL